MSNNEKKGIMGFENRVNSGETSNSVAISIEPFAEFLDGSRRNENAQLYSNQIRSDVTHAASTRENGAHRINLSPIRSNRTLAARQDLPLPAPNIVTEQRGSNFRALRLLRRNLSDVLNGSATPSTDAFRSLFRSHSSSHPNTENVLENRGESRAVSLQSEDSNYLEGTDNNDRRTSLPETDQGSAAPSILMSERINGNANGTSEEDVQRDRVATITIGDVRPSETDSNDSDSPAASGHFDFLVRSDLTAMCFHLYALIFLLIVKFLLDYLYGIADLIVLNIAFFYLSMSLRAQVSKQMHKSYALLCRDFCAIVILVCFRISWSHVPADPLGLIIPPPTNTLNIKVTSSNGQDLSRLNHTEISTRVRPLVDLLAYSDEIYTTISGADVLELSGQMSMAKLIYFVAINDTVVRMITMLIKIIITALPIRSAGLRSRARFYVIVESISQLYRSLAPIKSWMMFIFNLNDYISAAVLTFFYMLIKMFEMLRRGRQLQSSLVNFLSKFHSERTPTAEELESVDAMCAICQSAFKSPLKLECGHIFCSDCVRTWLLRKQTCPMCRAVISDDPNWQDGSTSLFCQLW